MNDAEATIRRFWEIQDGGDYSKLADLFADDAVLVDPVFGTFTGGEAIAGFMQRMNVEMAKAGASFTLVELSGSVTRPGRSGGPSPREVIGRASACTGCATGSSPTTATT